MIDNKLACLVFMTFLSWLLSFWHLDLLFSFCYLRSRQPIKRLDVQASVFGEHLGGRHHSRVDFSASCFPLLSLHKSYARSHAHTSDFYDIAFLEFHKHRISNMANHLSRKENKQTVAHNTSYIRAEESAKKAIALSRCLNNNPIWKAPGLLSMAVSC